MDYITKTENYKLKNERGEERKKNKKKRMKREGKEGSRRLNEEGKLDFRIYLRNVIKKVVTGIFGYIDSKSM